MNADAPDSMSGAFLFPMRYVLKQRFWSWGDDFSIKNGTGEDVFFVDGKAFSWGDRLSFQDMNGNELTFSHLGWWMARLLDCQWTGIDEIIIEIRR